MTIRNYKKAYWICKDSFGKMIYAGDTVEVWSPMETRNPHQSKVLWNRIDGAFINAHPAHIKMHNEPHHRDLRYYFDDTLIPIWDWDEETEKDYIARYEKGYVKKVKSFYTE